MWPRSDTAEDGFLLSLTFSLGSLGDGSYRFRSSPGAEDCDDPGLDPDEVRLYLVILWGPVRSAIVTGSRSGLNGASTTQHGDLAGRV